MFSITHPRPIIPRKSPGDAGALLVRSYIMTRRIEPDFANLPTGTTIFSRDELFRYSLGFLKAGGSLVPRTPTFF